MCYAEGDLARSAGRDCSFTANEVRNLSSGNVVGSSQVTSIVKIADSSKGGGARYSVAFRARLVEPFLITLCDPILVPDEMRLGRDVLLEGERARRLLQFRGGRASAETLF